MMRRRRGPGLLMTAAVVGTAAHVGAKSAQKGAQQQANAQAAGPAERGAERPDRRAPGAAGGSGGGCRPGRVPLPPRRGPPAAPASAVDPATAQLQNLANLHAQGILTDEEYAAAKAKALGI